MSLRIWLDLECTGLDADYGDVLEIAVIATEPDGPGYIEVAHQHHVIRWRELVEGAGLPPLDPVVREMHASSGLLAECAASAVTLADAEDALLGFFRYYGNPAPGREPIAGSSPQFDKRWLDAHLPRAARYFNHRVSCASSLRQFMNDNGHELPKPDKPAHRALADIHFSIQTYRDAAKLVIPR